MSNSACIWVLVWLLAGLGLSCPAADAGNRLKVLIVDGYSNHDWQRTTRLLREILEPTALFAISVSTCPAATNDAAYAAWCPPFSGYDAVIQTCNDINRSGPPWPKPAQLAFESFIREGGGAFVYHSGNNAFPNWPAYNRMIGLGWRSKDDGFALRIRPDETVERIPPGTGSGTGHGARTDRVIHRLGEHPIHQGMPHRWMTPSIEVYTYARGPAENLSVLSWAEDPKTAERWPMEWVVTYGKGRVYSSTFGHVWRDEKDPVNLRCAGFQTLLVRTLLWLGNRPVGYPLPPDFPGEHQPVLRPLKTLAQ
jgi:type 1 glutamine amidotransferase